MSLMEADVTQTTTTENYTDLGHGRIVEAKIQPSANPRRRKVIVIISILFGAFIIFLLIWLAFSYWRELQKQKEELSVPSKASNQKETPASSLDTSPKLYVNPAVGLAFKYPANVALASAEPDPFPVLLELRQNDSLIESPLNQERPGWSLRLSRLENPRNLGPIDFAQAQEIVIGADAQEVDLGGKGGIFWKSPTVPQSFYLTRVDDVYFLFKIKIISQKAADHQRTIDSILSSVQFLPKADDPNLGLIWERQNFSEVWDVEFPKDWSDDGSAILAGQLILTGVFKEKFYRAVFTYPLVAFATLDEWVTADLGEKKAEIAASNAAGTAARQVYGLNHQARLYIDKTLKQNRRLLLLEQTAGDFDGFALRQLFDRLVAGIK